MRVRVLIRPKAGILDPQGQAVERALPALGFEGVSNVHDIDRLFKQCFGHVMGPLETADLIGVDTILYSLEVLLDEFKDPKYRPSTLLTQMVTAGLLGRKSGEGFYQYAITGER